MYSYIRFTVNYVFIYSIHCKLCVHICGSNIWKFNECNFKFVGSPAKLLLYFISIQLEALSDCR